ncbi:carbonic anhydrase [Desulfobacca acetoxidans]|uniref:Carbonic anhydrase n=1 Tax=Desulfobacca acetoxidans (strain ATCC 700848 / DSM 11109 / ASRB2) TaxID=880072 RepID=F2NEK5_DESAR|nr:carbonic anhydrase [Desulfobacca acetoxidans]AEB08195.1 carbonic anhydrase [Desulfobacca acetoxidans DSM 11109]
MSKAAAGAKVALENLIAGNQRFCQNMRAPREFSIRREKLTKGQKPMAAVLGCSDSRVSPELLFDMNLGEIFVVRTAGQVLDSVSLASIEYAVEHLEVPLLMVLGHEHCGAVNAAIAHEGQLHGRVGQLLGKITPSIAQARELQPAPEDFAETVTDLNIYAIARQLFDQSDIVRLFVLDGKVRLVLAKYLLNSGEVKMLEANYRPADNL